MTTQVNDIQAFAYAELLEILENMEKEYIEKIPKALLDVFKINALKDYNNHLDVTIPLEEQQISNETSALLAMLLVNYWYENEEEKQELLKIYSENEKKYQEKLREKYNPDKIFDSPSELNVTTEKNSDISHLNNTNSINPSELPIDYNSFSWHKKIFIKIRSYIYKLIKKSSN